MLAPASASAQPIQSDRHGRRIKITENNGLTQSGRIVHPIEQDTFHKEVTYVRYTSLFGLAIYALALCTGYAFAADYHYKASLICADCHSMHASAQHGLDGGAPPVLNGPTEKLLKGSSVNDTCLACHEGQATIPDVLGANTGTHVRQAGALPTGSAPYQDWKGHTLGSTATPPGSDGQYWTSSHGLECSDCHMQHGPSTSGASTEYNAAFGQYRMLRNKPSTAKIPDGVTSSHPNTPVTYAVTTNDLTKDVFEENAPSALSTTGHDNPAEHYAASNVNFNEPSPTSSAYANWCKDCHWKFHDAKGLTSEVGGDPATNHEWHRHPNADVNIGQQSTHGHSTIATFATRSGGGKDVWVKVMDPAGKWEYSTATDAATAGYTPSCFSCHKAHGNQNAFGLINAKYNGGTLTEEGTEGGEHRDLCRQCHVQGG
jgi:hypothetical protein